jgi:hypothetical protein
MMLVTKYLAKIILIVWLLQLASCNSKIYDPNYQHSGFVLTLQDYLGYDIKHILAGERWGKQTDLKEKTEGSNGNIYYKFGYIRTCRYIFEVDSKTDKIIAVDWEGNKGDCIIVP